MSNEILRGGRYFMDQGYKKVIAYFLIIIMMMSNGSLEISAANAVNGTISGTGELEGIVTPDVFHVELPAVPGNGTMDSVSANVAVSTPFNFIMDPMGLLTSKYPDKKIEKDATLYFENEEPGSSYDYSHISDALTIRNKSTMDVDVELESAITGMDGIKLTSDSEFLNDTSASVFLAMIDSSGKISSMDIYGSFCKTVLKGRPDAYKVIYDTSGQKYDYALKDDTELKNSGITFPKYTFRLTGACNPKNGWSNIKDDMQPEITVTWMVSPRPDHVAPSIGKVLYAMMKGRGVAVSVDLGSGNLAAKGIQSIVFEDQGRTESLPSDSYILADGILKFKAALITKLVQAGVTSQDYTVIFNDKANTQVKVTLTNENIAPSIEYPSYTMVRGKNIGINVDLGSGDLAADGIKSITCVKNGEDTILSTDNYTFSGGRLTIMDSYITALIKGGVTSREYTITFDNKAETQVNFTLTVDGVAPTIVDTSYEMVKDTDVIVAMDLGQGYLEAKGIKSIMAIKPSGAVELSSTNYTYDGNNKTLTIKGSYITDMIKAGVVSREFTIIFDNEAETQIGITLTAQEQAPSIIGADTYDMEIGKDIPINIDLGSGSVGARGITSVMAQKAAGMAALSTDDYTFVDGKLVIKGAYVTRILKAGITSREHTIIFDDKQATEAKFTLQANGREPSIAVTSYEMSRDRDILVSMDLGNGYLAAKGIKSIMAIKASGPVALAGTNYSYDATAGLTIKGSYITDMINAGVVSREFVITFDNEAETQVKITLTAEEKAPSIGTNTYNMEIGKDILIDMDLGSGSVGARGIKSVTAQKAAGTVALSTGDYTFTDGKLVIKGAYITRILKAGIASREHTIIFDDKQATEVRFTLRADGTLPSITTTSYEMVKGRDTVINVNLGGGYVGAKGIKSVKAIKASGPVALASTNYSYNAGTGLSIKGSYITDVIKAGNITRQLMIVFDNVAETSINVTLTARDEAPSIVGSEFTITSGRSVPIKVDLGSGKLRASGIKSITTVKSGVIVAFASSKYTFDGETLTISSTHVNDLIKAGVNSRQFIITFNDPANTKINFILKQ